MTEKDQADEILTRFRLIKNANMEYVMDDHAAVSAALIAVDCLRGLSNLSHAPYYNVDYWDKVRSIIKSQIKQDA